MRSGAPRQLATPLPETSGASGLVLSASKEIEPGARAMLLLAENLFRLDVVLLGDTLRTIVRNLSEGHLEIQEGLHPEAELHIVIGDVSSYQPGQGRLTFYLGQGEDRVAVDAMIGILRFAARGTVRVTGQAIIRQEPEP